MAERTIIVNGSEINNFEHNYVSGNVERIPGTGIAYDYLDTNNNTVVVNNATGEFTAYGAYTFFSSLSTNNRVLINNSTLSGDFSGALSSGSPNEWWDQTLKNNQVIISNSIIKSNEIMGGHLNFNMGAISPSPTVIENSVHIIDSVVSADHEDSIVRIVGGDAWSSMKPSIASDNEVTIIGGSIDNALLIGGHARNYQGFATATGNVVNIIRAHLSNTSIVGGEARVYGIVDENIEQEYLAAYGHGTATNNTVTISGDTTFGTSVFLSGGITIWDDDCFTGNTLNLHSANITVQDVNNFQHLHFYLPATLTAGATMLTVTGTANLTDGNDRSSTVNVGIDGTSSPLKTGDQIILIDASAGTLITNSSLNTTANGQGMQGVTLKYTFAIEAANNLLTATISSAGPTVNPQTKALSEGFLGGAALVNQGADLIAGQGMSQAVGAAEAAGTGGMTFGAFGALSGGWSRYNTGSHVDMSSLSLMTGLSWGRDFTPGRLTLGAFFEYGTGSYDTHNSFSNAASVHGDGDIYHIGGGILSRMDFTPIGPGHMYTEASLRAGKAHNEYSSSDLRDAQGRKADYESSSAYYGIHAGLGYIWDITDKASLDLYGKYFWTRQEGDSLRLSTGDPREIQGCGLPSHALRRPFRL